MFCFVYDELGGWYIVEQGLAWSRGLRMTNQAALQV